MANYKYDKVLQDKIIRLHLEEGRTIKSLSDEYNLGIGTHSAKNNHNLDSPNPYSYSIYSFIFIKYTKQTF